MFIKNSWYIAAFSREIINLNLFSRTICGIPMVFYRQEDSGVPVAFFDACPHRFFPLSKGTLTSSGIQCGYHGLQFDGKGKCVNIPGQETIPESACVQKFPLVEKNNIAWVWPGDPALADEDKIPAFEITDRSTCGLDFSCFDVHSPNWLHSGGEHISVEANYRLVVDNLLDLSHADFIHRNTIGSSHTDSKIQIETHFDDSTLHHLWSMLDTKPPHVYTMANDIEPDSVDFWLDTHLYLPSTFILEHGVTASGRPREEGVCLNNINALTPETETTTHYFWVQSLLKTEGREVQDKQIVDLWRKLTKNVFAEDEWALAEQQRRLSILGIDELEGQKRITLEADRPSVIAGKMLKKLEKLEI
ncbi:MAG: phenylpropionate dioxygenase-like ring-hydroxylating dioxygenase large terminal subunit [Planctomycetota bacterium]|jgi:phenylpropionate dioxygenase-like ring-hydroxylating dioxygenase large terminal subunit